MNIEKIRCMRFSFAMAGCKYCEEEMKADDEKFKNMDPNIDHGMKEYHTTDHEIKNHIDAQHIDLAKLARPPFINNEKEKVCHIFQKIIFCLKKKLKCY